MYTVKVQPISFNIHMHLRRNFVEGQCFSGKTFYAFALIHGLSVIGMQDFNHLIHSNSWTVSYWNAKF